MSLISSYQCQCSLSCCTSAFATISCRASSYLPSVQFHPRLSVQHHSIHIEETRQYLYTCPYSGCLCHFGTAGRLPVNTVLYFVKTALCYLSELKKSFFFNLERTSIVLVLGGNIISRLCVFHCMSEGSSTPQVSHNQYSIVNPSLDYLKGFDCKENKDENQGLHGS